MSAHTKILLLIPHLGGGGAEKVFALLAEKLSREKYELHLGIVTNDFAHANAVFPGLTVHRLGAKRVRFAALSLLCLAWKLKPRVILCGMFHLNFLVLMLQPLFPPGVRILVRQNGTVSSALADDSSPRLTGRLYRWLYRRSDAILCQSEAMARDLADAIGIEPDRIRVLPNPIDIDEVRRVTQDESRERTGTGQHLLAVGRLSREKGFDILLEALVRVRASFPGADLVIAGDGAEKSRLETLCRELGLSGVFQFVGSVPCPAAYFKEATAFVLASRQEGMPNALLEAAAAGLPIIATPASGGVIELLSGSPGAWVASDISPAALAASIMEALSALEPGQRFPHPFIARFATQRAIPEYERVIDDLISADGASEAIA